MDALKVWLVFAAAVIFGIGVGHATWADDDSKPVVTHDLPVGCDLPTLVHDYKLLRRGYGLALAGHRDRAFNLGGRYAAIDVEACE